MGMTVQDRRFTSTLLIIFGPLFVAGGFLAAFTIEGALFVFVGLAMLVTSGLLRTRLPVWGATVIGIAILAVLLAEMVRDLPG